jgi:hypothetical protein
MKQVRTELQKPRKRHHRLSHRQTLLGLMIPPQKKFLPIGNIRPRRVVFLYTMLSMLRYPATLACLLSALTFAPSEEKKPPLPHFNYNTARTHVIKPTVA